MSQGQKKSVEDLDVLDDLISDLDDEYEQII